MKLKIWRNRLFGESEVLGFSSQRENYPAINAASTSPTQKWRTSGVSAEWISFDLGGPIAVSALGIFGSNLTAEAQVKLFLSANSDFSEATELTFSGSQVVEKLCALGAVYQKRYAKVQITDAANSDGFLEIGSIWLAGLDLELQPTEFSEKEIVKDIYNESYDAVGFYFRRPSLRSWTVSARITSSGDLTALQSIISENTTSTPFYLASDDDTQILGQPITTFSRFVESPEINFVYVNYWSVSAELQETR